MIWLTWRQLRTQAWTVLAAVAVLGAALALTGLDVGRLYRDSGLAACRTECDDLASGFLNQAISGTTGPLYAVGIGALFVLPAIIGMFWGAPLVARELEAGTHRLVWNQSVTRGRWLAVKLLGGASAGMVTAGLCSLAVSWWAGPIDRAYLNRMFPEIFATRGIVPIGYAALAFVVGVTAGLLVRRTVPAMAVTLVVVAAVQAVLPLWVRPHLVPPVSASVPFENVKSLRLTDGGGITLTGHVDQPGAWVFVNKTVTRTGQLFTGPADPLRCNPDSSRQSCADWLRTLQLRQEIGYQPASRFWALQWAETGVLLGVGLLLAGFCFWWVRRRLS
jgi:hypothetical protein